MRKSDSLGEAMSSGANDRKSSEAFDDGDHRRAHVRIVLIAPRAEPVTVIVALE